MKAPLTHKFSIGKIIVDPKSNAIYLNGVERRLEPKLINLLCLFAAQGRDVISRQEITQTIWSEVIVGEESINRAIFALRNALGDDAKQPQYIETIPKKGYRFLVDAQSITESPTPADATDARSSVTAKRSLLIYLIASILFGVILVVGLFAILARDEKSGMEIENIRPLNKMEGVERAISLSADGNKLLFIHDKDKQNDLYSRDLQTTKEILWVRDEFIKNSPVWIDDNTIAYIRHNRGENQIVRNYQGQAPQLLYTSTKPILQLSMMGGDSENLFFLELKNNDLIELKSLNLRNGNQQNWRDLIPDLPNKMGQLHYSMKPNTLLIVKDEVEKPSIVSVDLVTKKITPINNQFGEINKITAVNDHSLLVVGIMGASEGIWFIDTQKQPQLVLRASGSEKIVDVQMDVKRNIIFYANLQRNIDIQMVSSRTQEVLPLPELNSSGMETTAFFADNKKFIYFVSNRTGYYDVWRYEVESKSLKQISTLNAIWITWMSLSHSGKSIAIGYRSNDVYVGIVNVETGQLQKHVSAPSLRFPLAWSYDDKTIYVSEHQAEVNLFSYDATTLKPSLFEDKSGLYVKDIDGKTLIYVDYKRHGLVERNLSTQQEKTLHDSISTLSVLTPGKIKLNKTNDGFYAGCQVEWQDKICLYSFSATNSIPVPVSNVPYWHMFDITDDGETVLAADIKPSSGDIMKMQLRH